MDKKLQFKDYLFIGSMLFGLFFGAGNLIFPVHMGQEAGNQVFAANLGFLVTGIGLPFLGVVAIGISQSAGVYELATRVHKKYAFIFTLLLYLVIGPFFAMPRLATTSFEIGLAPFIPEGNQKIALALFSIAFFAVAWFLSRKPSKILDYVGKFLNPLFLLLLGILIIFAFISPLGSVANSVVQESYQEHTFLVGFTQGYNTLDALASLAFGILVVNAVKELGVTKPRNITLGMIKSGTISIFLMGVIYTLLSYMGTMSLGTFPISANGGIALAEIAQHYLGTAGGILLALIIIVACLKTAIGLSTAFAETFVELFPKRSYLFFVTLACGLACLFANVGLTNIIALSIPVLMFIYPLAMTLILLTLISPLLTNYKIIYQTTTAFTLVAAILDALNACPAAIKDTALVKQLLTFGANYLPFFDLGMGWVLPAAVGFIIGFIISRFKKEPQ
ncbi:LIVCS family branched-chain amino acid:cation transporter [Enterococcus sp. PF1-24]|uniref:branched-chain amino acid transport system II carrier protein n=1 Tax=unclassified Enterococcus TaxID=2608891 RepID=UPI002473CCF4|nr:MULTISPECIES: branched-chain amino acid transport system II carrier protein [unclassified Enterococcus]MDH6363866.1 LIVCS family branched-chain amino acid:cation transporter [Enterococcus sp. PFB1-1]MDH6400948.1 LIVCS family branched-chain amino acid:cation transporter [Enterococcus sp. PF1-24]